LCLPPCSSVISPLSSVCRLSEVPYLLPSAQTAARISGGRWTRCGYEFEDTVYWRARELVDAE
jgi:hypothetical protein